MKKEKLAEKLAERYIDCIDVSALLAEIKKEQYEKYLTMAMKELKQEEKELD